MYKYSFDLTNSDFNPTVLFASKQKVYGPAKFQYHDHKDFAEITYILSGKTKYKIEGQIHELEAGDMLICNPGVMHMCMKQPDEEPVVEFYTGFSDFQFKNMPPNSIVLENGYILRLDAESKREVTRQCYEMVAENETNKAGKYFMLKAHLMQILILIMREVVNTEPNKQKGCNFDNYSKNYAVKQVLNYLEENFEHKISLDRIAKNMYLSPVYISKIFKEETGESPINYLIRVRLERAKEILEYDNTSSIKNVATQVGYEDVYHFSKLFKKYYGISPMYYRRKVSQG